MITLGIEQLGLRSRVRPCLPEPDVSRGDRRLFSTPIEMFDIFRHRIEKAASVEYEKGNFSKSQMRDAAPVVGVRTL